MNANNAGALAATLCEQREQVLLFRTLATLRTDIKLFDDVEQLRWNGPRPEFDAGGPAGRSQGRGPPRRRPQIGGKTEQP